MIVYSSNFIHVHHRYKHDILLSKFNISFLNKKSRFHFKIWALADITNNMIYGKTQFIVNLQDRQRKVMKNNEILLYPVTIFIFFLKGK